MAKLNLRNKHFSTISILAMVAFLWIPSITSAATVAYSTDFSKTINLVLKEDHTTIQLGNLELNKQERPYGQGISAEVPAVFMQQTPSNVSYTEDGRFPTGLWLLGSVLIAIVGYKRMRTPND